MGGTVCVEAGGSGRQNDPPPVELETSSVSVVPQSLVAKNISFYKFHFSVECRPSFANV